MRRYHSLSFNLLYSGKQLKVFATPVNAMKGSFPSKFNIYIDDVNIGIIESADNLWRFNRTLLKQELADAIGNYITKWYE